MNINLLQTYSTQDIFFNFKKAGDIHQKVYPQILSNMEPNMKLIDLAQIIESIIHRETNFQDTNEQRLLGGIGFPIGLSKNECAAHWTPNPLDTNILLSKDLIKIDYGVHIGGCIVDGAYTFSFNSNYRELIQIAEQATQLAINASGPEAILGEIGTVVQEYIESHEIVIANKTLPVKSFRDLTGHKILPWEIHADKCVPNFKIDYPIRMKEGEFYAIETFPTTGNGRGILQPDCSHYQINTEMIRNSKSLNSIQLPKKDKYVLERIFSLYQTLPFCKRWLSEEKVNKYQLSLKNLVSKDKIKAFPPINDIPGSYVAQSEKTILVNNSGVEVLN